MAGSIKNNGSAWGQWSGTTTLATWSIGAHGQILASQYGSATQYEYIYEVGDTAFNYRWQIYTDNNANTLAFYSPETNEVIIATGSPSTWGYFRLVKTTSTTFALEYVAQGGTSFTTIASTTVSAANLANWNIFRAIIDAGTCTNAVARSWRLHSPPLSQANQLLERASTTPVNTTDLKDAYCDGATPDASTWGQSTGSAARHLTVTGTAVYDSGDPIAGGGPLSMAASIAGVGVVASPVLKKRVPLAAASVGVGSVAAAVKKRVPLASAVAGVGSVAASLRNAIRIAASTVGVGSVTAAARASKPLAASVAGTGTVTAESPDAIKRLTATAGGTSAVAGALGVRRGLAATAAGSGAVSATPSTNTGQQLAAVAQGTGTVAAAMRTVRRLAASAVGGSVVDATLRKRVPLAAAVAGAGAVNANLTATSGLVASAAGTSAVAGALSVRRRLAASAVGTSTVTATAHLLQRLAAVVAGAGATSASLSTDASDPLAATASGSAIVAAALRVRRRLASAINGVATFVATLRLYGETVATPYTIRPTAPRYTITPTAPIYSIRGHMDRYPDFDPQTRDYIEFDLVDFIETRGVLVVSATVVQVDGIDAPFVSPTITLDPATVNLTKVRAYVTGVTALVGALLRLRCTFTFADGRVGNITGILPIKHT